MKIRWKDHYFIRRNNRLKRKMGHANLFVQPKAKHIKSCCALIMNRCAFIVLIYALLCAL